MPLRMIATPFEKVFGVFVTPIANAADARVIKYYNSDFGASLKRANETGEDLVTTTYGRFAVQSALTIPDRFQHLFKEIAHLPQAAMVWTWSLQDYFLFIQAIVRLFAIYLAFKCIGRDNLVPLIGTDSIYFTSDDKIDTDTTRAQLIASLTQWAAPLNPLL